MHVAHTPADAAEHLVQKLSPGGKPGERVDTVTRSAEELLEFGRLRELLRRQTTSALGGRAMDALSFGTDRARLEREFATMAEAVAWLRQGSEMGFGGLADPAGWSARLDKPGAVLEPSELLEVASLADTAGWLREAFRETQAKFPLLTERATTAGSPATNSLAAAIRRAIEPGGEIRDDASPELRRLRTGIGRTRENIQSTLQSILRARGEPPGEDYVTQRNDRYVIPVRASERRGVQGVVHAASATGQTVFLEPLETIELNNRLVQLSEEEAAEIARILRGIDRARDRRARRAEAGGGDDRGIRFAVCAGAFCARVRCVHAGVHGRRRRLRSMPRGIRCSKAGCGGRAAPSCR